MRKKIHLAVRIDQALREDLLAIAKIENRTLSNLVETVLLRYVASTPAAHPTPERAAP